MAIEQNIERIADTLEKLAAAQAENLAVNRAFRDFLMKKEAGKSNPEPKQPAAPAEDVAPMDTADAPEGMEWTKPAEPEKELTLEELKAFLHVRGYDFPKGTKRTTLLKAWQAHKDEPVKAAETSPVEPPPLDVNPVGTLRPSPLPKLPSSRKRSP